MRAARGIGADRCGAAVFDKAPFILEGIACILGGDQLCVALHLGMVVQRGQHFARRVAHLRCAALSARKVGGPAILHILSLPQTHLGRSGVLHAETDHRLAVWTVEILLAFILVQLELLGQFAVQIVQQCALAQIGQQCAEAFWRFGLSAPVRELGQIPVKQRVVAARFLYKILEVFGQRKGRSICAGAPLRLRRRGHNAFTIVFAQHADGGKLPIRRNGDLIANRFLRKSNADKLGAIVLFGNVHAADHVVDVTEFLYPAHGLYPLLPLARMLRQAL